MFTTTPALCLERGGVPHIEADMANDILFNVLSKQQQQQQENQSTPASLSFYYAQSYFDAISLCTPCKVSKRDALTEMGLRSYADSPSFQTKMNKKQNTKNISSSTINFNHILLPRSPLYPVAGGLPTAEAGPSQDLIQGRVMMTTSKWNEVVSTTKPDIVSPLCELIAIQEASQLPARKKQSLTMRNEKWMKETIENISSSCDHHQVQFLFPLGTHFINEKANNNNNNRSNSNVDNNTSANEDAAVPSSTTNEQPKPEQEEKFDSLGNKLNTGVTINEALYELWCRKGAVMNLGENSNNKNNFRLLGLLTLSSGETKEQLQQYLTDLFNALVPLEQKMLQKTQEQSEQDGETDDLRGKTLPPLKLVVGNVSDLSLLEEVSKVFFSTTATNGGSMKFDTEIICLSSIVPVHLAANGLALQRTNATSSTTSSSMLKGSSPSSTTVRRERDATNGDQENTTTTTRQDPHQQKLHQGQEAASQFSSSSSVAKFQLINLWDPTFKFSTLPLSCASASENKEELMKMNREFHGSASSSSCDCYTCQRHTAGYFHHLLDVHEMNAEILISVHNYTQWFKYLMMIAQ